MKVVFVLAFFLLACVSKSSKIKDHAGNIVSPEKYTAEASSKDDPVEVFSCDGQSFCLQRFVKGISEKDLFRKQCEQMSATLSSSFCSMKNTKGKCEVITKDGKEEYIHYQVGSNPEHLKDVKASCQLAKGT